MARLPYTNFHDINLDWMIKRVMKAFTPDNPPPYPVKSVNGKTGVVQLTGGDIPFSEELPQASVLDFCDYALESIDDLYNITGSKQDAPVLMGSPGQVLGLDADQTPVWLNNPSPESIIDDNAGLGDTTKVYSANYIAGVLGPMVDDIHDIKETIEDNIYRVQDGTGLIELGSLSFSTGGNQSSQKAIRYLGFLPDTTQRIVSNGTKKFKLFLLAFDNNGFYQGHTYGSPTLDLSKTNSEGTAVYDINMADYRAKYPFYQWKLLGNSDPWETVTLTDAEDRISFTFTEFVTPDITTALKNYDVKEQNNWSVFFPCNADVEYTVYEGNNAVWVKFYSYVLLRGIMHDISLAWSKVMSDLPNATFETNPDGVTNCLKMDSASTSVLVFDLTDDTFKLIDYNTLGNNYPNVVIFAQIWPNNFKIYRGVIYDGYVRQMIHDLNGTSDYSTDPQHQTQVVSVNDTITYDYADNIHIGWISDIHTGGDGRNKPFDYCTELTKYGQISAFMITGDLNKASSESTLAATKKEMSNVARHFMEMKPFAQILPCRGNHDGVSGASTYTNDMFDAAIIKPFISTFEPSGAYYYDVGTIRIIMLNSSADSQSRKGFTSAEVTWLTTTLTNMPAGYSVIVAAHHPINADMAGTTPSDNLAANYASVVSALQTFKNNRTDCDLIGYFFGHMHADQIALKDGFMQISLVDSSGDNSDFSADILCIDTTQKIVNLIRLGEGNDRAFGYGSNIGVITG